MRKGSFIALLVAEMSLVGCGVGGPEYVQKPQLLPSHVRTIALRPFVNKTAIPGLTQKLMLRLSEAFVRDGRMSVAFQEDQTDGVVAGEIVRYIKEPLSYDANHVVEQYKLWVIINIRFIDKHGDEVLWEEPRLEQVHKYIVETKPDGTTEEVAREMIWNRFAIDIVKRTISGFGSVSGASEKKISIPPSKQNNRP